MMITTELQYWIAIGVMVILFIVMAIVIVKLNNQIKKLMSKSSKSDATANQELESIKQNVSSIKKELQSNQLQIDSQDSVVLGTNTPLIELVDITSKEILESNPNQEVFLHQIRFYVLNIGRYSLKDVLVSIKDTYVESHDYETQKNFNDEDSEVIVATNDMGVFTSIPVSIVPLKSRKMIYLSSLPQSFGVAEYEFTIAVEWNEGFYQMDVRIEEFDGNLKYFYSYFDKKGNPINFEMIEKSIKK